MAFVRRYAVVLVALAVVGIAGCGGSAQTVNPNQGTVEGYIFGRSRSQAMPSRTASRAAEAPSGATAINDAIVTLNPGGRRATTGVDHDGNGGYFKITGLDPGSYTATVTRDGYNDATFTVNVLAGTTTVAGANNGQTVLEPTGTMSRRKWTVMVYMDADCDLEEYGVLNMNQMESVGSDANVNYVVQFDRGPGYDATNGDWTDTRRFLVTKDNDMQNITSPMLQNMGEVDMGQPSSLTDFITWAKTTYPADHYCLILWNHGAGWR
ncbi:MAG TPA: clostripain-related cysteine peptidase, partial [Armatimonadota bacterium]|nr:clostripain-related cysteine peptidase [Armatimonadota bacterium]